MRRYFLLKILVLFVLSLILITGDTDLVFTKCGETSDEPGPGEIVKKSCGSPDGASVKESCGKSKCTEKCKRCGTSGTRKVQSTQKETEREKGLAFEEPIKEEYLTETNDFDISDISETKHKSLNDDALLSDMSVDDRPPTYSFNPAAEQGHRWNNDQKNLSMKERAAKIISVANFNRNKANNHGNDDDQFTIDDQKEPPLQCKTCSLQPARDETSVIIKCYACHQINTGYYLSQLEYSVFFIQVANYTDPRNLLPRPSNYTHKSDNSS